MALTVTSSRITLDTTAYSHLRRGRTAMEDAVADAEVVFFSATVIGELESGFRHGNRYAENHRELSDFLREPYVSVLSIDAEIAGIYGKLFSQLKSAGTPISVNDIWIAAAAIASASHLITFDSDFRHVDGLAHTLMRA